ncbi:MAG: T9SS type A sorting domain-containing protein [Ignavibacteria bacterium]|nr:T9SS type A sorting domain-containing protein [Ignavibacteria bacterium]
MKKFTFLLAVVILTPFLAFSQISEILKLSTSENTCFPIQTIKLQEGSILDNKTIGEEPNLTFRTLTQVVAANWSMFGMVTPVVYDPISKAIIVAISNFSSTGTDLQGTISLYISTNYGQTWTPRGVFSKTGDVPVLASVAVMNPNKSTSTNALSFLIYSPFARKDITGNYPWAGGLYTIVTPNGTESIDFVYPGNLAGYRWWTSRMTSHNTGDGSFAYNVGMLSNSTTTQYGQYGFSAFSLNDYDFLFQGCPTAWALSKFRTSTNLESTYNSNMMLDVDNQGSVYAAVCNYFQPNVGDRDRVPGVSKSTDYGVTWSEFQPMPVSILNDYFATWGGTDGYIALPYDPNAFVVVGPDEYSIFTRVAIFSGNNLVAAHIVEAQYSGGLWTINKVADWSALTTIIISDVNPDGNTLKDSLFRSFMGMELQAAKTEDNRYIVVKWIDYINKAIVINPPVTIADGAQVLDTLPTNDVFFAYRERNQFFWSNPFNATDDTVYNKVTWIPAIVPSLDKIPLIMERPRTITNQQSPRFSYPNFVQQFLIDTPQDVLFASVNLLGTPGKVELPVNPNFYLKDAQPNPATSEFTEIGFVLDKPMNIKLELFDVVGNKVKVLYDGFASPGVHAVVLNTNEVPSGVYFYRLTTNDGISLTKQLSIVK